MDSILHNVKVYGKYTKEYMDKFMDLELYRDSFMYLANILPRGSSVLELGCGPGNVIKYLRSERNDIETLGVDLSPEMLAAAQKNAPASSFRLLDIRDIAVLKEKFDCVIAAFSIPYLISSDLPGLFKSVKQLIRDDGYFYLSFMERDVSEIQPETTSFTGNEVMYISYYKRSNIQLLLSDFGFAVKDLFIKDYEEMDGSFTTELIYILQVPTPAGVGK